MPAQIAVVQLPNRPSSARKWYPKLRAKPHFEPKQGSVVFESTLANEISFVDSYE
jgi:hypothetical protein